MTDSPAISVIVPVYNAEKYIRRCLDSLLAQTFRDFEIILIDDGSPDGSGAICDGYSATDSRIRVIHQENKGVSLARQCGIDHARGEYTIHADPDDWVEPDLLGALYQAACRENADIAICDFFEEYPGRSAVRRQNPPSEPAGCIKSLLLETMHSACWNKLVRKELYDRNGIRFPSGISMWEDMATIPRLFYHARRTAYVPRPLYHYVSAGNSSSISKDSSRQGYLTRKKAVDILSDCFRDSPELSEQLLFLKLKIRTALIQSSGSLTGLKEAMQHYPEADTVIWKHPTLSFYARLTVWLCSQGLQPISLLLIKARRAFKSLKNI